MKPDIVHFSSPVTLVGAGQATARDVKEALRYAPNPVAADGGAHILLEMGKMPQVVIGDMDSLDSQAQARLGAARLHPISEQNSTDFDKCLRSIAAPLVLGVGFGGMRLDHHLAALSTLLRYPRQRCILLGEQDVTFLVPPKLALTLAAGARVSLFPLLPCVVNATGLRWPLDGLALRPGGRIGTSNEATGGAITLRCNSDALLVILARADLDQAVKAVLAAPRRDETKAER